MCTVTIIPLSRSPHGADRTREESRAAVRMACNRDELRSRPAALPARVCDLGPRRALMPIDPVSEGTWIGVNDAGLAATLLNVNLQPAADAVRAARSLSRGVLVPRLLACATLQQAQAQCEHIDPRQLDPFRLVLVDDAAVSECWSDGNALRIRCAALAEQAHLFTSSGLGDCLVAGPRRALFEQMLSRGDGWAARQDAFHRHSWPNQRHLSVCMERSAARTVSHSVIEIEPSRVVLTYFPGAPDAVQPLPPLVLPRQEAIP